MSERTRQAYTAHWNLFTDWCHATDSTALPADPRTVLDFLAGCPAAVQTQRGRVTAIDHHHTAAGHPAPGKSGEVLAALGRPVPAPFTASADALAAVRTAMRYLPSHGWTQGMFGRRDRCLLVLSQLAGVPYRHLATLTAGDITLTEGVATIRSGARNWTIPPDDDAIICGPCAIVRWLRVLDIAATKISTNIVAKAVGDSTAVQAHSPHLCRSTRPLDAATLTMPLLPPINQWGALPFPHPRLTPHSQSRRTRDLLAGDIGAHRTLPVPTDDPAAETPAPQPIPANTEAVYDRAAAQQAWAKRRDELQQLTGLDDVLTDIDQKIADLQHRVTTLLDTETT